MTSITRTSIASGATGGLLAGIVSGFVLQVARTTTPDGVQAPAMTLVAGAVHTAHAPVAWVAYLVYAALIGAGFGWLLHRQQAGGGLSVIWGVLYGGFWWIFSGLVVIPALYGVAPLTSAAVDVIRNASLPWFAAMLVDGGVLGAVYALLVHRGPPRAGTGSVQMPRAA